MAYRDKSLDREYDHFIATHGATGPIIDVVPPKQRHKKISEWTFKETCCALFALLVIGVLAPWIIMIGGLLIVGIWDAITRL